MVCSQNKNPQTGIYRFADLMIRITTLYAYTHCRCEEYRIDGSAYDFEVIMTQADIDYERALAKDRDREEGVIRQYADAALEFVAVYRRLAERIPLFGAVLVHGSAIAVDQNAYLFVARSGTGKSTHTRLWRERFGDRAVMVNDDKPLLRLREKCVDVCGSPWDGKHRLSSNITVPLRGFCVLEQAKTNTIARIGKAEAYQVMLQQIYRPEAPESLKQTLIFVQALVERVAFWRLKCNMEPEAAEISFDAMHNPI